MIHIDFHHHHHHHFDNPEAQQMVQATYRRLLSRLHNLTKAADAAFATGATTNPTKEQEDDMGTTPNPITGEFLLAQFAVFQQHFSDALARGAKTITDLQAQVASGTPVTQEQLGQFLTSMQGMQSSADAFDITTAEPPAPIPPPAVPPSA